MPFSLLRPIVEYRYLSKAPNSLSVILFFTFRPFYRIETRVIYH